MYTLYEAMIDYRSYIHNLSSLKKKSGLKVIRTHLCDTAFFLGFINTQDNYWQQYHKKRRKM